MKLTEWYPGNLKPVREGPYDVVPKPITMIEGPDGQPEPDVKRLNWCFRNGQWGFWVSEHKGVTTSWLRIDAHEWRGREATPRVKLLEGGTQIPLPLNVRRPRVALSVD